MDGLAETKRSRDRRSKMNQKRRTFLQVALACLAGLFGRKAQAVEPKPPIEFVSIFYPVGKSYRWDWGPFAVANKPILGCHDHVDASRSVDTVFLDKLVANFHRRQALGIRTIVTDGFTPDGENPKASTIGEVLSLRRNGNLLLADMRIDKPGFAQFAAQKHHVTCEVWKSGPFVGSVAVFKHYKPMCWE